VEVGHEQLSLRQTTLDLQHPSRLLCALASGDHRPLQIGVAIEAGARRWEQGA